MVIHADYVRLCIQGDQLILTASTANNADKSFVGSLSAIRKALETGSLNVARLEQAITLVEDLITPNIRLLPSSTELKIAGPELENSFHLLPSTDGVASIEAVEWLFNQLADYVQGSPVAWRQRLAPVDAAVGLVVLREVMHHGDFGTVTLLKEVT